MNIQGKAQVVAVYIGESDRLHGTPLYAKIVERAKELGLAGATVTRGLMGFGANSHIHTAAVLRLSEDLPIVIQIIDQPDRLAPFLSELKEMVPEGLIVTWDATIEHYGPAHG